MLQMNYVITNSVKTVWVRFRHNPNMLTGAGAVTSPGAEAGQEEEQEGQAQEPGKFR